MIADDASGLIQYTGWSPAGKDNSVVGTGGEDYAGTLSMTGTANASAIVRFKGWSTSITHYPRSQELRLGANFHSDRIPSARRHRPIVRRILHRPGFFTPCCLQCTR